MSFTQKVVITISDDEDEGMNTVGTVSKPQNSTSLSSASTIFRAKVSIPKQDSFTPNLAMTEVARGGSSNGRSMSVSGLSSGQNAVELESRSRSEPKSAAAQQEVVKAQLVGQDAMAKRDSSITSAPRYGSSPPVAPVAYMGPQPMAKDGVNNSPCVPSTIASSVGPETGPLTERMAYQRVVDGPTPTCSDLGRPSMSAAAPKIVSPCQGTTEQSIAEGASPIIPEQPLHHPSCIGQQAAPSSPKATEQRAADGVALVNSNKLKRKSNEASQQVAKRTKTPVSIGPSRNNSGAAVDSILWSTPPHDPGKDSKTEGSSATTPKQPRKPRSKPWTCKMLAELGALIQASVPWAEFAEKNGKTLADVLETYSVVVSMPLLELAERGEKRNAQKKLRDMRQKYKDMEKEAVKAAHEQVKKAAEDASGGRKKAKGKEVVRSGAKLGGVGKEVVPKAAKVDGVGKPQASGAKLGGAGKTQAKDAKLDGVGKTTPKSK